MRRIVAGLALALLVAGDAAAQTRCEGVDAVVYAVDDADLETGCAAARDGAAFLAAQGLDTRQPIEIRFVEVIADVPPELPALGCFVHPQQRIYMLTFEKCRTRELAHGLEVDRTMHRALIAHEVAHSLIVANASRGKLGVVAQEYIAYVTMFATMPDSYRRAILQKIPGTGFTTEAEINLTIYLLDPVRFGAQAYRHFSEPANGSEFLRRILKRQVLVDDNPP